MTEIHDGGCHCRRVLFRAQGQPKFISVCHCESCRRTTGAAFSTWVGFPSDAVDWRGDGQSVYASSPGVRRGFCKTCGTPLSYQSEKWPGETHILIGAFNDPSPFTPSSDYMPEERLAWIRPITEKS